MLFGGHEHLVTVDGTCRREAFASTIRSSAEPEAISSVELLSDDGRKVNADVEYYGGVPYAETTPPTIRLYPDDTGMRAYRLSLEMFGGGQGDEYTLARSCPVIPVSGETSKEETLWGMYRAGGDQGSGRDKRGFDTPGMYFHSQLAAYSPLTEARKTHQTVKGNPRNSQI